MSDNNLDFISDNNPAIFVHLHDKGLIPQYVMESSRVTADECGTLNKVAFADPVHRLFPCHTKEACWQSAAYFAGRNMQDDTVKGKIVKMATAHGIQDDVEKVFNSFEGEFKQEEVEEAPIRKYAFTVDYEGFQGRGIENYYPVNSYAEVVRSAQELDKDYQTHRMNMPTMRKVASNLMEAAAELGVHDEDIPVAVRNFGEKRLPNPYTAQYIIGCRKQAAASMEAYTNVLQELCSAMEKVAGYDEGIELAEKAAAKIAAIDARNGIAYTPSMRNPYEIIFTGPLMSDMAKAAAQQVLIGSVHVPVADFLNIPQEAIKSAFSAKDAKLIMEVQDLVSGESTIEKCAHAAEKLLTLSPGGDIILLSTAARTGW